MESLTPKRHWTEAIEWQVQAAVAATEHRFGGIDVLVNNAGRGWDGSIEGTADEVVRRIFELNYFSVLRVLRAVPPKRLVLGNEAFDVVTGNFREMLEEAGTYKALSRGADFR